MIPNTELISESIPVSDNTTECPKCGDAHLGNIITITMQYCPCCDTWLRYARGFRRLHNRSTDSASN